MSAKKNAAEKRREPAAWNSELNQRRFALIDKEIQRTLTPAEMAELVDLTRIMREYVDSEAKLDIEGVEALLRRLLDRAADETKP